MNTDPLLGQELDGYRIENLLGAGGMARVYRGLDVRLARYVAVKVIEPDARADAEYSARFEKEARAVARLSHPHVVSVYRFGEVNGLYYMVMQFIDGADVAYSLEAYRQKDELMPHADVLRVARHVASALDYAHSKGVIHRDVKPGNVMLDKDGRAILTDFGLVLMQSEGTYGEIFGTAHYMAPEQVVSSAGVVPQSDQYALGVMLYEMLTGSLPFDKGTPYEIAMMHMGDPLPPALSRNPDLPPAVAPVLERALAKEPDQRYPSCAALAAALEAALNAPAHPSPRLSTASIPEQVRAFRAAHPLPPLPAAIVAPVVAPPVAVVESPTRRAAPAPVTVVAPRFDQHQNRVWLWVFVASAAVILAGVLAIAALFAARAVPATPTIPAAAPATAAATLPAADVAAQPSVTFSATPVSPSETPSVTVSATPSETPAVPTPTPAPPTPLPLVIVPSPTPAAVPAAQVWTIFVIADRDRTLAIVNVSDPAMPPLLVALLQFWRVEIERDGRTQFKAQLSGDVWGAGGFVSGQCVLLVRERDDDDDRDNGGFPDCVQVGGAYQVNDDQHVWKEKKHTFIMQIGDWQGSCLIETLRETGCTFDVPFSAAASG